MLHDSFDRVGDSPILVSGQFFWMDRRNLSVGGVFAGKFHFSHDNGRRDDT